MHTPVQNNIAGFVLSLITAFMWGVLPIAVKEILPGMDAATIVWYRFLIAGTVLLAYLAYRRRLPAMHRTGVKLWGLFLLAGLGLCLNYSLFSYSLNFTHAETTEIVIQLSTLFLIIGGVIVYKEPFTRVQTFGSLLILSGLLLFFNDRFASLFSAGSDDSIGVIITVFSAICWTLYALVQKYLLNHYSTVQILLVIYVIAILAVFPFASPTALFQLNGLQLLLLLFCCINTLVAYGCFAEALTCWQASKVSAMLALSPLFTIAVLELIVWIIPDYGFSDRLNLLAMAGAAVLVVGSVLTALVPLIQARYQPKPPLTMKSN